MSQYPSNRSRRPAGDYARSTASAQPGISRSSSRSSYGGRPASGSRSSYGSRPASSSRSAYGLRPSGQRPSGSGQRRPGNQRPGGGNRRPPNGGRRPNRKPKGRFYAFLALALVLVVAIILIVVKPGGDKPGVEEISELLLDDDKRRAFGEAGRALVKPRFDWRTMSDILIADYEKYLEIKKKGLPVP